MRKYYYFIGIFTIFVILIIIGGIAQTGGPNSARNIKLDEERINNFRDISYEIDEYYESKNSLPTDLQVLMQSNPSAARLNLSDPESKKPYEYKKVSNITYQLCANFSTDSKEIAAEYDEYDYYDRYSESKKTHPKGYHCISYEIDDLGYDKEIDNYDDDTPNINISSADNTKRRSHVTQILNAIGAYAADNKGILPVAITTGEQEITEYQADLCNDLVPNYIPALPQDPVVGDNEITDCNITYDTGYFVSKDSNNRVTVSAPNAAGDKITITR